MATGSKQTPLYSLPNEILVQILSPLTTLTLLQLASVSQRFNAVVLRILHYRLLLASSLKEHKLILECYHPVSKLIDPHFFCTYLGTPGLTENHEGDGSLYEGYKVSECLGRLSSVYSRFRPEADAQTGLNDEQGSLITEADNNNDGNSGEGEGRDNGLYRLVKKQINLDEFEDFSQLCAVVNLVKVLPNSTRLLSATTVEDGVVRIWRDWLKQQSKKTSTGNMDHSTNNDNQKHNSHYNDNDNEDPDILWVDLKRTVGLKLRVKERKWNRQNLPILMHRDEETAASYEVEIEEMRIRTTRLLMAVEQSLAEQNISSNAVIIGSGQNMAFRRLSMQIR